MKFPPSGHQARFERVRAVNPNGTPPGLGLHKRSDAANLLDLGQLLAVLRRRYKTVALSVLCSVALVGAYVLLTPEKFESTARVLIDTRGLKTVSGDVVIPGLSSDIAMIESQVAMVDSTQTAERVIDELGLAHRPDDAKQAALSEAAASKGARADPAVRRAELVRNIRRNLTVERNGLTYLINIRYTHENPEDAARMANAFAQAYLADQLAAKRESMREAADWLQARVSQLSAELRTAEEKLETYKVRHDLIEVGEETLIQQELAQYMRQLISARNKLAEAEARRMQVEQVAENPDRLNALGKALDSPVIAEYRRQHAEIRRKLSDLESRYGKNHALVANARADLANLDEQIIQETRRLAESVNNDYEAAKLQLSLLQKGYDELRSMLGERNLVSIGLAELKRDVQATRELHASLLKRLKETRAQKSLPSADARIVAAATPPLYPSSPKKKLALALALIGGLGLGVMLALVREHFDRVFHGPDDLERAIGGKPIAVQPLAIGARDALGLYRHVETHPDSPYAQSIFRIKSWVDANLGRAGNVVAVGSAEAREGKSTTAANLAYLAARSGQKVLLIDGDLHAAALTASLAPESAGSLIDVVSGERDADEVIVAASDAGFDFCPARPTSAGESASNIFSSRALERFLERAAQAYDLVIVDIPALNHHVDASILLAKSDLAVLLVCQEATTQPQLHRALDMLSGPPADRVAFVLSELRPRR
jgi:uncharacterized protein involved in exopolysaccharide biosynthesis